MSFSELGLSEKVLEAVVAAGYTSPTPIQAQAIPPALARRDVLGIAQTGTGKTAAFTLPMLNRLETGRARARMPRTLILEPTRELAAQVEESFVKLGANHKLSVALLIGGVSFADQDAKITRGVDVLIATPGRLLDHFERGKLLLTGIEILVIDEADRMLDMGFIPDIERICKMVPFTRQTLFFSATMPPEIQRLTEAFLSNPVKVEVARPASTASTITQRLVASGSEAHSKRDVLRRLIRNARDLQNAIVFCNRKRDVAIVYRSLEKHGFNVVALHGDMDQLSRMQALDKFRNGGASLLVASDVAARGLDIPEVSHVFNFDVPFHPEDYVHRIGRTGRAGRSGSATSIVTSHDVKALAAIESLTGKPIEWDGPTLDALLAEQPDLDHPEPRRERGRGASRGGEGRDRRDRREPRADRRTPRVDETRTVGNASRERPARHEPIRHEPVRAGDRPVHSRARHDDDLPVVGFGDHIPAFLLQKVVLGPPSDNLEPDEFDDVETPVTEETEEDAPAPAREASRTEEREPASGRKRSRKKRTIDIATPADSREEAVPETPAAEPAPEVEAAPEPAPEPVVEAPAPAAAEAVDEQPVKPARRTRKKAAAEPAAADEAPAKPARKRTRKAAATAETEAEAAAPAPEAADIDAPASADGTEPPKPARTRRTRATSRTTTSGAAASEAVSAEPAEDAPAGKPAPKRTTRKKAVAAEPQGEAEAEAPKKPATARKPRKKATPAPAETGQEDAGQATPTASADDLSLAGAHPSDA